MKETVHIIGGGLAGAEAAYQVRKRGFEVVIYEMKPERFSPAHSMNGLAELVCSNSLKAISTGNASGLLKAEMELLDSLIIKAAYEARVPAGGALAVDREKFSVSITTTLEDMGVKVVRGEVERVPDSRPLIIASGPLTSDKLASDIGRLIGGEYLYFYDAVSPLVHADSIDMELAFQASRYEEGKGDYINCPMNEAEYKEFIRGLLDGEKVELKEFEDTKYFEGCLPIEVMAERGEKTLSFGPMKPVGLTVPGGTRPYAVVQLRKENREGTLYGMVGFQTRLTYGAQKRLFSTIPGLKEARFARLGKIHRNSYIDSPRLLNKTLELRAETALFFAGQITGVEGYVESAASGLIAGINSARRLKGLEPLAPPPSTMIGALLGYITDVETKELQPMNANFGLLPSVAGKKKDRKQIMAEIALGEMKAWVEKLNGCEDVEN